MKIKLSNRFQRFLIRKWIFSAPNWAIIAYAEVIGVRKNIRVWLNPKH